MGLIAIDPGVHNMAIAVFGDNGVLLEAWNETDARSSVEGLLNETLERWGSPPLRLINRLQSHVRLGGVDRNLIVGERQVVYPGAKGLKTNPSSFRRRSSSEEGTVPPWYTGTYSTKPACLSSSISCLRVTLPESMGAPERQARSIASRRVASVNMS